MNEFLNITPESHDEALRQIRGKLYIVYFSKDCVFCRQAIMNLISMPENTLFTYAVCQVDGFEDFRMKEGLLSLPTVRIYENGVKLRETNGYNRVTGAYGEMQGSIERAEDYHPVYADHAATAPMTRKALKAFCDCAKEHFGNPSANYELGLRAKGVLNGARSSVLGALHVKKGKLIFTGGGSEADNQALYSAYREGIRQNRKHIITSAVEHHAVLHTLDNFGEDGFEITVLPVDGFGRIDPQALEEAIRPDTVLVSIMYANNETGTVQPVKEIGEICSRHGVLFHCDAVQAAGHLDIDLSALNIDYLSLAAHKFGGPKGVGALVLSDAAPVSSLVLGGGQENGHRAGTENVPGIHAMAAALQESVKHLKSETKKLKSMTEYIISAFEDFPGARLNGHRMNRLPGTVNLAFPGIGGRELLFLLDAKYGISASGGSACSASSFEPSHVLTAMGLTKEEAESAVRISLGPENTMEDAAYIVKAIRESVEYLRMNRGTDSGEKSK